MNPSAKKIPRCVRIMRFHTSGQSFRMLKIAKSVTALMVLESSCLRSYRGYVIQKICEEILEGKFILRSSTTNGRSPHQRFHMGGGFETRLLEFEVSSSNRLDMNRSWYTDAKNSNTDWVSDLVFSQLPVVSRQNVVTSPSKSFSWHNHFLIALLCPSSGYAKFSNPLSPCEHLT